MQHELAGIGLPHRHRRLRPGRQLGTPVLRTAQRREQHRQDVCDRERRRRADASQVDVNRYRVVEDPDREGRLALHADRARAAERPLERHHEQVDAPGLELQARLEVDEECALVPIDQRLDREESVDAELPRRRERVNAAAHLERIGRERQIRGEGQLEMLVARQRHRETLERRQLRRHALRQVVARVEAAERHDERRVVAPVDVDRR